MSKSEPLEGKDALLNVVICQRRQLLSIARRILHCPFLAEDVIQDAAVKVSHMQYERSIHCPVQFAKSMVRNLAIDQARRRKLESNYVALETEGENLHVPCADPCARLEVCEAINAVSAALDELPARTRHVFERVRIEGISQKAIAAELGVSPTLVNFMIQAAHRHCLARLQMQDDQEFGLRKALPSPDKMRDSEPGRPRPGRSRKLEQRLENKTLRGDRRAAAPTVPHGAAPRFS